MTKSSSACPYLLTLDLLSLNCLLSPELPSAQLKLWGLHSWWCLQENSDYFGWEEEPSLEACKVTGPWDARSHAGVPTEWGEWHLSCVELEPQSSSAWTQRVLNFPVGFSSKPSAWMGSSWGTDLLPLPPPSVIPFPRQLCHRLFPGPPASKGPGLSLCVMGARGWTDGPSVPLIATLQIPFWTRLQHPAMGIF